MEKLHCGPWATSCFTIIRTNFHGFCLHQPGWKHLTANEASMFELRHGQSCAIPVGHHETASIVSVTNATTVPWQTNAVVVLSSGSGIFRDGQCWQNTTCPPTRSIGMLEPPIFQYLWTWPSETTTGPILYTNESPYYIQEDTFTGPLSSLSRKPWG